MRICINKIRAMLRSLDDGSISVSALDMAWIARVPALKGLRSGPEYPACIQWILENQLADGSWDDQNSYFVYERVCSTLACVIALKTWALGEENVEKGMMFIERHISKMEIEQDCDRTQFPFVIVFPAMLDEARMLGLDICYHDAPMMKLLKLKREDQLKRISLNMILKYPITILHCTQGLRHVVDWEPLMTLQSENGSLLNSPALTAYALIHTGNSSCYQYLQAILADFGKAAPMPKVYPLNLFERLAIIYELQCLGISRYFQLDIVNTLEHAYRAVSGLKGDEDGRIADTSSDLYKASELLSKSEGYFQGDAGYLQRLFQDEIDEFHQKPTSKKDETESMEVHMRVTSRWYATLLRLGTRRFIQDYEKNSWIGRGSRTKQQYVNNDAMLALAKIDFNLCQSIHQTELDQVMRWSRECQISQLKFPRHKVTVNYFSIAAMMFEPDKAPVRLVWTRCSALATVLDDFFDYAGSICELREFLKAFRRWEPSLGGCFSKECQILYVALHNTINDIAREGFIAQDRDVGIYLRTIWDRWLASCLTEAEWKEGGFDPSIEDYMKVATCSIALEPIVLSSMLFLGEKLTEDLLDTQEFSNLMNLVNIIGRLLNDIRSYKRELGQGKWCSVTIYVKEHPEVSHEEAVRQIQGMIEETMMELIRAVQQPSIVPKCCKNLQLSMARILHFFYRDIDGYSSAEAMKSFVEQILFNKIE
ncbi:hypothetical protein O6H91_10G107700 [Diphasiastrum complanatum]|nr:hypothetical protein O6H91_10G107700 [Diphasiastrum complanatum]